MTVASSIAARRVATSNSFLTVAETRTHFFSLLPTTSKRTRRHFAFATPHTQHARFRSLGMALDRTQTGDAQRQTRRRARTPQGKCTRVNLSRRVRAKIPDARSGARQKVPRCPTMRLATTKRDDETCAGNNLQRLHYCNRSLMREWTRLEARYHSMRSMYNVTAVNHASHRAGGKAMQSSRDMPGVPL